MIVLILVRLQLDGLNIQVPSIQYLKASLTVTDSLACTVDDQSENDWTAVAFDDSAWQFQAQFPINVLNLAEALQSSVGGSVYCRAYCTYQHRLLSA